MGSHHNTATITPPLPHFTTNHFRKKKTGTNYTPTQHTLLAGLIHKECKLY